jgi:formylglycine-generating enzyme required for sulfatase activity
VTILLQPALNAVFTDQFQFLPVPAGTAVLGLEAETAAKFIKAYGEMWHEFYGRETPLHHVEIAGFDLMRYPVPKAGSGG